MWVKINNSDADFVEQVERLKIRFNVGTSTGASTEAICRFMSLEADYDELLYKHERLLLKIEEVQEALLIRTRSEELLAVFSASDFS